MPNLDDAYAHCLRQARGHYENFPVASRLLPRRLQRPVAVIYAFARSADDYADEGGLPEAIRLALLDNYLAKLDALRAGKTSEDLIFIALSDVIVRHDLPLQPFYDLLSAFRQDVTQRRYADYAELLDYCRRSANPVGRLILHLFDEATDENLRDADAVCTALQLINLWQDLAQDYHDNRRIYLPEDEMAACDVTKAHLAQRRNDGALRRLLAMQIARTRQLLQSGAGLGRRLTGRLGLEIRATVQGGLSILDVLERREDVFARPRLGRREWVGVLRRAVF